ncbi:recombinase family protein [Sphingobium sp. YR768]|uniref:recombinase family protein n=1 Tax=Sphingobium sp. YR768 TaxID=1884365 RepID=UPI0008CA54CA|nr:recombinase family protein [Sphingobium sp. YR768]SES09824.1 Resolvase, N terminal domain [Sphingobium sp. YR768]
MREGDTLVVTRLDRLARSTADLLGIVAALEAKKVALRIMDFGGTEVDTRSPTGRMLLTMFAAVAEFERAIMLERQRVGVARARAEGAEEEAAYGYPALHILHAPPSATLHPALSLPLAPSSTTDRDIIFPTSV